jgi:hypothetical protein
MKQPSRIWRGKIGRGKLWLEFRREFDVFVQTFNEGQDVELILRKFRRKRTLPQNSYLWGVVYPLLGEHCGYDSEEIHAACKERFLRDRAHEVNGLIKVRSSTSLDTVEMTEYIESVRRLAAEMGVVIPSPGEAA